MSVLYIGYRLTDGGAPHQGMAALHLARCGLDVLFATWSNDPAPSWLDRFPSLRYRAFRKRGLLSAVRFLAGLVWLVVSRRWDTIYVQGAQHTPFLLWLPALKGGRTVVYHTQDYLEPGQHRLYAWCERYFARRADWVISNEINRARFMASNYRLRRMPEVIRTALPAWWEVPRDVGSIRREILERAGVREEEDPCLVMAGGPYADDRMSPQLVEAMAGLPRRFVLVFTGMQDGPGSERCRAHADGCRLDQRVVTYGRVPYARLLEICAACDLGVLLYPNTGVGHFYQCPGRLSEYLRTGLPFVASNFPGLELLTLKHGLGAVADPHDPDRIRAAIQALASLDRRERDARRDRILSLALSAFAYEAGAEPVFERVLRSKK